VRIYEEDNMACIDATIEHNGNPPFLFVAQIDHEFKDGCHFFTSKKIPGLLVFSQSLSIAIKQLPLVIESLMKRNKDFECTVRLGSDEENKEEPDYAVIKKAA